MKTTLKYIVGATWQPLLRKYLSRTRTYHYKNIRLQVPSSVFHPGFFFSTHLLLDQIKKLSLKNKKLLEPGAGSGLISVYAAQHGATVTATDINPVAVECLKENSEKNKVQINIIESDLFDEVPSQLFDIIVINPPYYKKEPESYTDYAWNCGENGEYFQKLFSQLKSYIHTGTKILMVLCDGCDVDMVKSMADEKGYKMRIILIKKNMIEKNFIYSIETKQ
jgi:release factor glutamine methyltransferase